MIKPFIWFFSSKRALKQMLTIYVVMLACLLLNNLLHLHTYIKILLYWVSFLFIQGYLYELIDCIIQRKREIIAPSIYNKKVKSIFIITPPDIKILKLIWRGVASIIASILLYAPYALLLSTKMHLDVFDLPMQHIKIWESCYFVFYKFLFVAYFFYVPAFLWNYANSNSVLGVLDIRRTSYVITNNFPRYIFNAVLFALFYLANDDLTMFIINSFASNTVIFNLLFSLQYVYFINVIAYLLGTITQPEDLINL